jgi:vacuolar-type H+-ATPase subunit H
MVRRHAAGAACEVLQASRTLAAGEKKMMRSFKSGSGANDSGAEYYVSPRVHDDAALPQLVAEMRRFREDQEEIRRLLEELAVRSLVPAVEGAPLAETGEAATGRQPADPEARDLLVAAREEFERARVLREGAEREVQTRVDDAEEDRQRLLADAQMEAEEIRANARAQADACLKTATEEAEAQIQTLAGRASEERQHLLRHARGEAQKIRTQANADAGELLRKACAESEQVRKHAEAETEAGLGDLKAEIRRAEAHLEALKQRKTHIEFQLAARVRELATYMEPEKAKPARQRSVPPPSIAS